MDNKYTEFIENYLINDKTKSAIMLIGGWGTGKSYYIQNVLKPYLEGKQKACIIVSLYGLNDLKDISKAIYLEERLKKLRAKASESKVLGKAETQAGAKIVGKTIVKGVASFFNVDLSGNEEDLQRLYESLDLSGKLIILEDLERTNIPIKDVLGYVNNLVEQDGVKVLLVANEREILKSEEYEVTTAKGETEKKWRWTAETEEYLKTKEKTVSDTIIYVSSFSETIENILQQFTDDRIEGLLCDTIENSEAGTAEAILLRRKVRRQIISFEISDVANKIDCLNFRSFIFACQKTTDILRLYNKEIDRLFVKHLFMSVVAFSFRLKNNDKLYWDENQSGSSLGTSKYPLFRFAHDYIKYQHFDAEEMEKEEKLFLEQKKFEKAQSEVQLSLNVLYEFYSKTSDILEWAISDIKKNLEDPNAISLLLYGKLANYLVLVRDLINTPTIIDDCKTAMKNNLATCDYDSEKVSNRLSFHDSFRCWTTEQEQEYKVFIAEMQSIVKSKSHSVLAFDYSVKDMDEFSKQIRDDSDKYVSQRVFLKRIDIPKLISAIEQCSSEQIDNLRRAIGTVYSFSNINAFFMEDKPSILQLKDGLVALLSSEKDVGDKVKRLQLSWFVGNLDSILEKLN